MIDLFSNFQLSGDVGAQYLVLPLRVRSLYGQITNKGMFPFQEEGEPTCTLHLFDRCPVSLSSNIYIHVQYLVMLQGYYVGKNG